MNSILFSLTLLVSVQVWAQDSNGVAVTTRSSCVDDNASMNVKTKEIIKTHEESLQTSGDWTVNGKIYSMAYIFGSTTGNNPVPTFIQIVRDQKAQDSGQLLHTTSQALMLTPSSGVVENFTFTKDNFIETDGSGKKSMYEWINGAKGNLINVGTQEKQPDGTTRSVGTNVDPGVYNGWTTAPGGSVETCTITALSREAWLVVANDPKMAADLTNLDSLAFAANQAEVLFRSCTASNCPPLYADLAAKEQAFATTFNGMFDKRKTDLSKQYAAVRAKIAARRRAANYDRHSAYNSNNSGIAAALDAVRAAKEASYRNSVVRELQEIREQLERRRHP